VDPRWLELHPERDPVIRAGHSVVLPARPTHVTVVRVDGRLCPVDHVAAQEALAYLKACGVHQGVDWAWVVRPDGTVARVGVSHWNSQAQDALPPGSWVWAPPGTSVPQSASEKLARLLATQGPAIDRADLSSAGAGGQGAEGLGSSSSGISLTGAVGASVSPRGGSGDVPASVSMGQPSAGRSHDLEVTSSDYGTTGLLQTPSARLRPEGSLLFSRTRVEPYTHMNVVMQPLKDVEFGLRYTAVGDKRYSSFYEFSGDQTYKDKGFDVKFGLVEESRSLPAVAVGLRDVAGTGFFSSEYVVASKRFWGLDLSAGVGWGQMAGVRRNRTAGGAQGGSFSVQNYFSGRAKPFAGLQWSGGPYVFKAELDPNDYRNEPSGRGSLPQRSRYNFGLSYRATPWLDIAAGWERGNTLGLTFTLHTDVNKLYVPKLGDPPGVAVVAAAPTVQPDWKRTARDIKEQTGWSVGSIRTQGGRLEVELEEPGGTYRQYRADRAVAVLHRDSPAGITQFTLRNNVLDVPMSEQVVDRGRWVESRLEPRPPSESLPTSVVRDVVVQPQGEVVYKSEEEPLLTGFRIGYGQHLGSPAGFILYQIYASQSIAMRLGSRSTWLTGSVRLRLVDNFDNFKHDGLSGLPPVRTYLRRYMTESRLTVPSLAVTHARRVSSNQYVSLYGGYLEEMFAGVGAEWLYRPFASRLAFGVDANVVRQREFTQRFGFLDPRYQVATGHATAYWDTGWNGVELRASFGRYLARDVGGTLEAVKFFKTGVVVGAFVTKTNVSAKKFGEGSFDKGIFLSIPFDAMFTKSTNGAWGSLYRPLTRDGGAKLVRPMQLYDLTGLRDRRLFDFEPAPAQRGQALAADDANQHRARLFDPTLPSESLNPRPTGDWEAGGSGVRAMEAELFRQGFYLARVSLDEAYRLNVVVAHNDIRRPAVAVGRVLRGALSLLPHEVREVRVAYESAGGVRRVEYDFVDLGRARGYLVGTTTMEQLREHVVVRFIDPAARVADPLEGLSDLRPVTNTSSIVAALPRATSVRRVSSDIADAGAYVKKMDWMSFGAIAASGVLSSTLLDQRLFKFSSEHSSNRGLKFVNRVGDFVPWLGLAGAGLLALDGSDPRRSATGYASAEAGVTAALAATGLKYAFGRARPNSGLGRNDYRAGSSASGRDSFPSRHTAMSWALATPFALEYNAPWLYGLAAVTNLSRVGKREHWFSDTVGGGLLGYGIGRLFWESSRNNRSLPQVLVAPDGVNFSWTFK
jgi:membrane-associated phospholipid phosphatase